MIKVQISSSIEAIRPNDWKTLMSHEIEDYHYLQAVEQAELAGFSWIYIVARRDDRTVGVLAGFSTRYDLATTLDGFACRCIAGVRKFWAGAFYVNLASIGSPCTETAPLGLSDELSAHEKLDCLSAMVDAFEREALARKCNLLAVKDAAGAHGDSLRTVLSGRYCELKGQPLAILDITFDSIETYFARLSYGARKDMRRKLRTRSGIRLERRNDITDVIDTIMNLYAETLARADMQLEELTANYFEGVLRCMPGRAQCVLYYHGDELLAANLVIEDSGVLLDKFLCMKNFEGRKHNIYFLSWLTNVEYCLQKQITSYKTGQSGYSTKIRLGSRLEPTQMYFRHRNPAINLLLSALAPILSKELDEGALS